jgi:hypothetical protein
MRGERAGSERPGVYEGSGLSAIADIVTARRLAT